MKQKEILYLIVGLLMGVFLSVLFPTNNFNTNNTGVMKMMGISKFTAPIRDIPISKDSHIMPDGSMMENMDDEMTMDDMTRNLKGKKGDEFDKLFISEMIEHHQGAIDMSKLAKIYAGHQEIKDLADDIILAQSKEITLMKQWKKDWGF